MTAAAGRSQQQAAGVSHSSIEMNAPTGADGAVWAAATQTQSCTLAACDAGAAARKARAIQSPACDAAHPDAAHTRHAPAAICWALKTLMNVILSCLYAHLVRMLMTCMNCASPNTSHASAHKAQQACAGAHTACTCTCTYARTDVIPSCMRPSHSQPSSAA